MNIFEKGLSQYLSKEHLNTIQNIRIGIGGAGGLGSNCAMILVRTGFKNIILLDKDIIEPSNLNRQQYFLQDIGKSKVEISQERLLQINPDLDITIHHTDWSEDNGDTFFPDCHFIIEAFDQADFKWRFVEFYQDKTNYVISGNGMAGLTQKNDLKVQKIGNVFVCGDGKTDAAKGHPPLAPRVMMCAALMAEKILDLTLNINR